MERRLRRSHRPGLSTLHILRKQCAGLNNCSITMVRVECGPGARKRHAGARINFGAGGWRAIIAGFFGSEPLLRIFCEMPTRERAERAREEFREFLEP